MEPSEARSAAFEARISGRVQGVGFRYGAIRKARHLGVTGWVRNDSDGAVTVHAEGTRDALDRFDEWLRIGPPGARVQNVEIRDVAPQGAWHSFSVEI